MPEASPSPDFMGLTTDLVCAYVSRNEISATALPNLISETHSALKALATGAEPRRGGAAAEALQPAVPVKKSITADYIVCLEDGEKFKSLKRHLHTYHQLSPEQYREKWGLRADYPMVPPSYSATRSRLAKKSGLGRRPK